MPGKSISPFLGRLGLTVVLLVGLIGTEAYGAGVSLLLDSGPIGGRVNKRVKSLLELRQERVILQNLDYSCGAAALATVLRHGFGADVTERELISLIFVFGQTPKAGIKKYFKRQGFTLLDLKRAARSKGYPSIGYKGMELQDLTDILSVDRLPILVPIRPLGYNHFVVLKGIYGSRVYMADPAFGNKSMKIHQFLDVWIDGIGFIIKPKPTLAKVNSGNGLARNDYGIEIVSEQELASISAAGLAKGMMVGKATRNSDLLRASDRELEEIAAGQDKVTDQEKARVAEIEADVAKGALVPGVDTSLEDTPSETLLNFDPEGESVEYWRIQRFLLNTGTIPGVNKNIQPTIPGDLPGRNIVTFFELGNFTGRIQFGEPAGNFFPDLGGPVR
ncbi:MAG: C39 family peptidase [Nitrospirota bacterium]|nr:MAG: C39 family peptidase [Nitrospirota bacterium]